MSDDYRNLLLILAPSLLIGWLVAQFIRRTKPDWCKSYAKFSLNQSWKILLLGFVLFTVLAVGSLWEGQMAFGIFFLVFAAFELSALAYFGFREVSPERLQAIETSDPRSGAFQYRYWHLLVVAIIGSWWVWALVDWAILEDQRALALEKERHRTVLRIRDEVAVEASRAFLNEALSESKREALRSRLYRCQETDPTIVQIDIERQVPGSSWVTVVSSAGSPNCWPPSQPTSGEIIWRGTYGMNGRNYRCDVYCVQVVVPEFKNRKEIFQLRVAYIDPKPQE